MTYLFWEGSFFCLGEVHGEGVTLSQHEFQNDFKNKLCINYKFITKVSYVALMYIYKLGIHRRNILQRKIVNLISKK